jgi:hypothetical protein
MARGPRKSLDDKIKEKKEIIEALKTRIKSEQAELDELLKEKQDKEIAEIGNILRDSRLTTEDARRIIEEYVSGSSVQTA